MTLEELLKGRSPEDFDARALSQKAHWRLDRDEHRAAALLFDAAHASALASGVPWRAYRNRAATCWFDAGEVVAALPRIEVVLADYEVQPDEHDDRHWVEHATQRLHRHAFAVDPALFEARYRLLTARAARVQGRPSPWIHPFQEELAELAQRAECRELVRELVALMRGRRPMPRRLAARLHALEDWADA